MPTQKFILAIVLKSSNPANAPDWYPFKALKKRIIPPTLSSFIKYGAFIIFIAIAGANNIKTNTKKVPNKKATTREEARILPALAGFFILYSAIYLVAVIPNPKLANAINILTVD